MKKEKVKTLTYADFKKGLLVNWHNIHNKYTHNDLGEVVKKSDSGLLWYVWFPKTQAYGPYFPEELVRVGVRQM